jgi:hypothetical protein
MNEYGGIVWRLWDNDNFARTARCRIERESFDERFERVGGF